MSTSAVPILWAALAAVGGASCCTLPHELPTGLRSFYVLLSIGVLVVTVLPDVVAGVLLASMPDAAESARRRGTQVQAAALQAVNAVMIVMWFLVKSRAAARGAESDQGQTGGATTKTVSFQFAPGQPGSSSSSSSATSVPPLAPGSSPGLPGAAPGLPGAATGPPGSSVSSSVPEPRLRTVGLQDKSTLILLFVCLLVNSVVMLILANGGSSSSSSKEGYAPSDYLNHPHDKDHARQRTIGNIVFASVGLLAVRGVAALHCPSSNGSWDAHTLGMLTWVTLSPLLAAGISRRQLVFLGPLS